MSTPRTLTAYDAIEFATRVMEGQGVSANQQSMRWALNNAYMEIGSERDWSFLQGFHRIVTNPAQSTGTVEYKHYGGTYDRMLTITGGTWPSWSKDATVVINGIPCAVEAIVNSAVLVLDVSANPGQDIAAGTSYTLYRNCYPLPSDCRKIVAPKTRDRALTYIDPVEFQDMELRGQEIGDPLYYTIRGISDMYGQNGIYLYPAPAKTSLIDFAYFRHPRQVRYTGWDASDYAGTVSATAGTKTVTGVGVSWSRHMLGSIIRFSGGASPPTGLAGANPWVEERSIVNVLSPTSLVLDAELDNTYAGVKYRITDPIDIDPALHQAFLWCVAHNLAVERNYVGAQAIEIKYRQALETAKATNKKTGDAGVAGIGAFLGYERSRYVVPPEIVDDW